MKTRIKLLTAVFCFISIGMFAQTTDEIVKKHIDAIGGKENWDKLKSIRMESTIKAEGAEVHVTVNQIDKKSKRQDISVMGMTGFEIITTTNGWNYFPWQGQTKAEAKTADDVKNSQDDLSIQDEFLTYKDLKKKLEYFGKDDVDGTECFKLKMTDENGKEVTFYIDPTNYYVIKQTQKIKANGQEMENSTSFSNYKKQDSGIVFPMSIAGNWGESQITKLEINPTIDDSLFKVTE